MNRIISYKKSILFSIGFLFFNGFLIGQDSARIRQLLDRRELARAKEAVDSVVVLYPGAVSFLLKAEVYQTLSKDAGSRNLSADAKWEAFQSLQKAVSLNRDYTGSRYQLVFDLYNGFLLEGIQLYNAAAERDDKNGFAKAIAGFKKAAAISQYIYTSGWGKAETDTISLFYLSKSAINAEKEEDALFYSKKIADNKIIYPAFRNGYEIVYQWLVYYYKSRKDREHFDQYLALAREAFPQSAYFILAEIDALRDAKDYNALFKMYRELLQKEPGNENYRLGYYRDQFNYIWGTGEAGHQNRLADLTALTSGLRQLAAGSKQVLVSMNARLVLAKVYINQAQDLMKELLMRSTIDPKVTGSYKKQYRELLLLSNKYLRQITMVKAMQQQPVGREAAQLLRNNLLELKLAARG